MLQIKQSLVQWMDTVKQLSTTYADFDDIQLSELSTKVLEHSSEKGSIGWIFRSLVAYVDEKINFLAVVAQEHAALEQRRLELDRLSKEWTTCKSSEKRRVKQEWKALNEAVLQGRKKLQRKLRFVIAEANDSGASGLLTAEMNMFKQLQLIFYNTLSSACSEAGILATSEIQSEIARFHNSLSNYDSADDSEEIEVIDSLSPSGSSSLECTQSECSFDSSVSTQSDKRSSASSTTSLSGVQVFRNAKVTMLTAWEQMADDEQDRLISVMTAALLDKGKSTEERLAACDLALIEVEGLVAELCSIESRQPAALKMVHHVHGAIRQFLMPEISVPESLSGRTLVRVTDFMLSYSSFVKRICVTVVGLRDEEHFHSLLDDGSKDRIFRSFLERCDEQLSVESKQKGLTLVAAVEQVQEWTAKTKVIQAKIIALHAGIAAIQAGLEHVQSETTTAYERLSYTAMAIPMLRSLEPAAKECAALNVRKWTMDGIETFDLAQLLQQFEQLQERTIDALIEEDLGILVGNSNMNEGGMEIMLSSNEAVDRVRSLVRHANENLEGAVAKTYIQHSAKSVSESLVRKVFASVSPFLDVYSKSKVTMCGMFEGIAAEQDSLSALNRLDKAEIDLAENQFKAIKAAYASGLFRSGIRQKSGEERDDDSDNEVQIKEMNLADRVFQLLQSPVDFVPVIVSNWCKDEPHAWRTFVFLAVGVILSRKDASTSKAAKLFTRLGGLVHKQDLGNVIKNAPRATAKGSAGCFVSQLERVWPFVADSEMAPTFEAKASPALARQASSARLGTGRVSGSSGGQRSRERIGLGGDDEMLRKMKELVEANQALEEQLKCEEQRSEQLESVVENFQELFKEDLQALGDAP